MMQPPAEKLWVAAQQQLRAMLNTDTYHLWFAPLRANALENDCVVLEVANDFCELCLKANYMGLLQEALARAANRPIQVRFKVVTGDTIAPPAAISASASRQIVESPPEKGYT